jgi:hypothetical protein
MAKIKHNFKILRDLDARGIFAWSGQTVGSAPEFECAPGLPPPAMRPGRAFCLPHRPNVRGCAATLARYGGNADRRDGRPVVGNGHPRPASEPGSTGSRAAMAAL